MTSSRTPSEQWERRAFGPPCGRAPARHETPAALRLPSGAPRAAADAPSAPLTPPIACRPDCNASTPITRTRITRSASPRTANTSAPSPWSSCNGHTARRCAGNGGRSRLLTIRDHPQAVRHPKRWGISCLRYRHATLNRPEPGPAPDATLHVIAAALANAGPTAAVWLAASLALHHICRVRGPTAQ